MSPPVKLPPKMPHGNVSRPQMPTEIKLFIRIHCRLARKMISTYGERPIGVYDHDTNNNDKISLYRDAYAPRGLIRQIASYASTCWWQYRCTRVYANCKSIRELRCPAIGSISSGCHRENTARQSSPFSQWIYAERDEQSLRASRRHTKRQFIPLVHAGIALTELKILVADKRALNASRQRRYPSTTAQSVVSRAGFLRTLGERRGVGTPKPANSLEAISNERRLCGFHSHGA